MCWLCVSQLMVKALFRKRIDCQYKFSLVIVLMIGAGHFYGLIPFILMMQLTQNWKPRTFSGYVLDVCVEVELLRSRWLAN